MYRARDTRLERDVAVKVLPSHLIDTAQARDRFQREARAVAALQHPNICTIHDVGDIGDGQAYLVMAYQDLLTLWKDADPDLALPRQAESEYAALK